MHHAAFVARSMLGLNVVTIEEGYEERRAFIKQFAEITESVVSATGRVSQAIHNLSAVLLDAQNKLEILSKITVRPEPNTKPGGSTLASPHADDSKAASEAAETDALTFYCRDFGKQLHAWRSTRIAESQATLDAEVSDPLNDILEAMREVETLRQSRTRALQSFDVARSEVQQKEAEYAKKGKVLSESRMYPKLVERRDTARGDFEDRAIEFNVACDELMDRGHCTTAQAFQALLHRTTEILTELVQLLGGVLESTGN